MSENFISRVLKLKEVGVLELGNRNNGMFEDMCFLERKEFTNPIMTGIDVFRRRVVVLQVISDTGKIFTQILYVRHTHGTSMVSRNGSPFLHTTDYLNDDDYLLLEDLVSGKLCEISNYKVQWESYGFDSVVKDMKTLRIMTSQEVIHSLVGKDLSANSIIPNIVMKPADVVSSRSS